MIQSDETRIYRFGSITDGDADMADLLGGKGAFLAGMSKLGVPVPPGFTLPCPLSIKYMQGSDPGAASDELALLLAEGETYLEGEFGYAPLVSVRSGSRKSMPGMMDTILNVGITSGNFQEWADRLGLRCALDSRRRLIQMFASVAMGVPLQKFEEALHKQKASAGVTDDKDLSEDQLSRLIEKYLAIVADAGLEFPDTREDQIMGAVCAVFESWDNERAADYRKINGIPYEWGTGATVQAMVFGNFDDKSCTGVVFTRDPATGENFATGDWLPNAQGEDVVAGIRKTEPMYALPVWGETVANELFSIAGQLEAHFKDMQDIEFTVQSGKLYILQCRRGQRSAAAAFAIAHDMAVEGLITKAEALGRVSRDQMFAALSSQIDPTFKGAPIVTGIPAGGSVVSGQAVFNAADAVNCTEPCILVRKETDPDDFAGMAAAVGILTSTGGATSHAAVVARGMNKACVVGATELNVSTYCAGVGSVYSFKTGDMISIDGATGNVYLGEVPVVSGATSAAMRDLCSWALEDTSGIAQRLEISGAMSVDDIVAACQSLSLGKVYVDTATLERGDLDNDSRHAKLVAIGQALSEADVTEVVVDCLPLDAHYPKIDRVFDRMLPPAAELDNLWILAALLMWPESIKAKSFVKNGNIPGFKQFVAVNTFHDLLGAEGPIDATSHVINTVFGGKNAYTKAVALVEASKGVKFSTITPAYWYGFLG